VFLVKKCPSCARMLRFPIDRGKIRVTCVCGREFIADPDDTTIYEGARFDLSSPEGMKKRSPGFLTEKKLRDFADRAIRGIYDLAYRLQNFFLLPSREQVKLAAAVVLVLASLFLLVYLICAPGPGDVPDGVV